ncbi:trigger factor [Uliginosibacterium sp. H1]|uniref:trigger factor n=1 Tax=Uliginosibacterium sp. H1 TaxID=3114757 RepID=UPI002E17B856|nr:trigger factor [Uliginosibacterium sp. H1]
MQTNEVTQGALARRIDMAVSMADVEKDVESRLKKLARTVKMHGFRPGKVPLKIVEQTYGPQVRSEAIGAAVERVFGEKVREQNLRVAGYPDIQPADASAEGTLAFSATFEVYPEVKLGDLSAKEIERPVLEIGEAEVDRTLEVLRKQRATFEAVDRASQPEDRIVIDFTGRKDGVVFDGGQATDFPVVVGGGQMLPEFDVQLHGAKAGETRQFDLTFPAEYQAADLAGKTVQFEITVKRVEAAVLPEVDAAFAKTLGIADGDIARMREEVKTNLEREAKRRVQVRVRDQVLDALIDATAFDVPKALIDAEAQRMAEAARQDLVQRGIDAKNVPVEAGWFTEQAIRRVKLGLIVAEMVKDNDLQAKPEQVRERVQEMAQSYEQPAEFVKWFYSQRDRLSGVEDLVVEENVVAWVLSRAKASDKVVSFDELMGNAQA